MHCAVRVWVEVGFRFGVEFKLGLAMVVEVMVWVRIRVRDLVRVLILPIIIYSKTPIYRGVWGKGNIRGKSWFTVNRGFVCLHFTC